MSSESACADLRGAFREPAIDEFAIEGRICFCSGRLEVLVWSIPAMTVFLVGGVAWVGSHDLSPRKPIVSTVKPLRVQVASLDWKWLFIYPDLGVASVNRLTVPVGTPVTSAIARYDNAHNSRKTITSRNTAGSASTAVRTTSGVVPR